MQLSKKQATAPPALPKAESLSSTNPALIPADNGASAAWASVRTAQDANLISLRSMKLNRVAFIFLILTFLATLWAAYAASKSVQIARNVFNGVNRPYLVVEYLDANFGYDQAPQNNLVVRFRIKNIGGAPAIIDTYGARLGFEDPAYNESWQNWLGGSNIMVIEKDGYSPMLQANYSTSDADFKLKLVTEHKTLVWRVNFSYTDLSDQRRNFYFTNYYMAPPFSFFRSNYPPRVIDAEFDQRKAFIRRNLWWNQKNRFRKFLRMKPLPPQM